ncbi:MAG TPA: tetratricopeptide repeat protein, partial [Chitinivibrionales bacterium]
MYSIHCPVGVLSALLFLFSNVFAVNDTPSIFTRAERLFADSQYMSALETYRECINQKRFFFRQTNDDAAKAFYKIGLSYYRTANFSAAATAFEEYMRLYPGDGHFADALLMCAHAYAACQDFKNASEEWYRAWIRGIISSDRQTPLWEAAQCAEKDGNEQRAVAIYTEFLQKFPLDPRTTIAAPVCAELLIKQKKFSGAAAIIDAAEKQWPNNEALITRLLYIKALSAKSQMKTETARRYYSALINRSDDFPEKEQALTEYAAILTAQKQYKELMQVYKKIADIQQKNGRRQPQWDFTLAWARCARSAESFDVAEKLLRQLLDANQTGEQPGRVLLEIAECYLAKKDSGSALNVLQEIISDARHPDSLRAKAALAAGEVYCGEGLFPQAIAAYRAYCSIPGLSGADGVQYTIAALYQSKGLYATAIQEYDRFLRLYPQSPRYYDAVVNAGRCEEAMGHFSAALDRFEYAAQSDARPDIVEQAKKYKENAQRFGVVNIDGALVELERLAQKSAAGDSSPPDRLMRMAGIFENMLSDFSAALDLYDQAARCIPAPSDSVSALIIYCKAIIWEK